MRITKRKPLANAVASEFRRSAGGGQEYGRKDKTGSGGDDEPGAVKAELERIGGQIKDWCSTNSDRIKAIEQKLAIARTGALQPVTGHLDVSKLIESDGFKALRGGAMSTGQIPLGISIKALINFTDPDTSNSTMPAQLDRIPGYHGIVFRPLRLLEVLPSRPISADGAEFIQFSVTGDADVQQGEGEEKAEIDFNGELKQVRAATIAAHTTASAQVLDDNADLGATIQRVLVQKLLLAAETQILTGSGTGYNVDGIYTQSSAIATYQDELADRIGEAIVKQDTAGYPVNIIVMNPLDWFAISILKDNEGRYLYGNPASPAQPTLWNTPVIRSAAQPQGTALIGHTGAVDVLERQAPTVVISRDHKDYRTRNLVLILAETRLSVALYDLNAFKKVDLSPAT